MEEAEVTECLVSLWIDTLILSNLVWIQLQSGRDLGRAGCCHEVREPLHLLRHIPGCSWKHLMRLFPVRNQCRHRLVLVCISSEAAPVNCMIHVGLVMGVSLLIQRPCK